MTKINKSEMMRIAHAWAKQNLKKVGDYRVALMLALKNAWKQVADCGRFTTITKTIYQIKAWFMSKNADKLNTAHCYSLDSFKAEDIIQETEKAYKVQLALIATNGQESKWTKVVWVPKSVCELHTFEMYNA